jgi:flavin reductase (DIM6/NTAB) family NADH-FMN oxidoreductase RutF
MEYAANDLTPRERYKVLASFVLPRPIAWVTSVGPTGVVNAAPFSFFNVFCEDPPLCVIAVNRRSSGEEKDTLANIQRTGEFVVNIADEPLARAMHESGGDFPPEVGEPGYLGLKLAPSTRIAVPRLADTPWAMECKTWKTIDVNGDRQLIMGEGIHFHIRDELWDDKTMRVHMDRYHPIGRMFADRYCRTDDRLVFPAAQGASSK